MASGVRYRYKGRFVSEHKASALSRLPNTKSKVTTEYHVKGEASHVRKGFQKPIATLIGEALKRSRQEAAQKRKEAAPTRQKAAAERKRKAVKDSEKRRAIDLAERAAKRAQKRDIDIGEALDQMGFDGGGFEYYSGPDIETFARDYIDYGEEFFDFDMADLEDEDKYGEAAA